ncbi:MAG: hypothetical protein JW891_07155 [Candidatus Lokiarchaeota archaeon]|nr:hypothetical protein [Candidatus Lokiarchaeota archaeon]
MILLGIIFTLLQVADIISTNIAIKTGCSEANPLIKDSVESKGFPISIASIKIILSLFLTIMMSLSNIFLNILVLFLDIVLLIVVVNNITRIPVQKKYNRLFFMESATIVKFTQFWDVRAWVSSIHGPTFNKRLSEEEWKFRAFKHVNIVRKWIKAIHHAP